MIPGITASLPVAAPPPPPFFPVIADDNAVFNDEGSATTGWGSAVRGTVASDGNWLRFTRNATGGASLVQKSVSFVSSGRDFIIYAKVQSSVGSSDPTYVWFADSGLTQIPVSILLNLNSSEAAASGAVTIRTWNGSSYSFRQIYTGRSFNTNPVDIVMQFDTKFDVLNVFERQPGGELTFLGRQSAAWVDVVNVFLAKGTAAAVSNWVEFDFITIARPNIIGIGDSIQAGSTLYNPNPALALTNYTSTWMNYAALYPSLRNNLVVNRGVGGETSAGTLARITTDALAESPRLVILHASTNDEVNGISLSDRTDNIQDTIDAIVAASAECVLLNAMYGTSTYSGNTPSPDHRDYMLDWWDNYRPGLTDLYASLDIMQPLLSAGFMNSSLTQSDGIHPTNGTSGGYEDVGDLIEAQPYAP